MSTTAAPAPPPASIVEARRLRFIVAALLVAIVCAFAAVVRCDFIDLDDRGHVLENPLVTRGLSLAGIADAFARPHASLWIPLTWVSFMAEVSVFGLNPGAMHATNLALHATAAVLLLLALRRMTGRLWESAAVAALFGLHPINVESVAWVTERKNVLCAVFWMLTLLAYARHVERPSLRRYAAVFTACAAALLAKPLAVTLPCVLLLLDFWPLRRRLPWSRLVLEKLPLCALALGAAAMQMRALALRDQAVTLELVPLPIRVSNALTSCAIYLGDLAWPARLGVFYPHPMRVQFAAALCAAALLAGATLFAWRERERRPFLLTGWLWFLGTLVPMIGLVQAGSQARADRFTYLAQIGIFIAVVWSLRAVRDRRILGALAGGVLVALALLTARQVGFWNDSLTLCQHTLEVTGPNPRVETLTANALARSGDYAAAIPHYERSLRLLPEMAETWNDCGAALTHVGRDADAASCFAAALARDPAARAARYNLATTLARLGHRGAAIAELQTLAREMPDFARARFHLGCLLAEQGDRAAALEQLRAAAQLLPGDAEIRGALAALE